MLPNKTTSHYSELLTSPRFIFLFVTFFALAATSAANPQLTREAQQLVADAESLRATWKEADLREALKKYDNAAATWTRVPDLSSASLATLGAGDICFLLGEFAEALKRYEAAEKLAQRSGNRLAQGRALSRMGRANSYLGNNELARSQVTKALALLKVEENDPNLTAKSAYGEALINMAEVTHSIGFYAKVLDQLKEARRFLDHDREGQARIHLLTGNTVGSLGDAERALWESDRALELYHALNNKVGVALARVPLGMSYAFKGPAEPAIPIFDELARSFRSIGDRYGEAIAMNGLGQAYERLGNLAVARNSYETALHLSESIGALDVASGAMFKLGKLHVAKDPEKALAYLERCVTLSRSAKLVRTEALALTFISVAYAAQNRPSQATEHLRKAQSFSEKIGDRRSQVETLNLYGFYLFNVLDQKQQALNVFRQALPLSEAVGDTGLLLESLFNLASAHVALGDYEAGLPLVEQSLKIIEEVRDGVRTPDLRTLYFSSVREHYELCTGILMQLHAKRPNDGFAARAFLMSEKSRSRSLIDLLRETGSTWRDGATPDELRREREVIARLQSMSDYRWTLSLSGQKDSAEASEVADEMAQLKAEYYKIQAELRRKYLSKPALAESELNDIAQVQRMLPADGTMLLEYALGDERSYLWAITPDSFQSYELPARKEIESAAIEVYNLLRARQQLALDNNYQAKIDHADSQFAEKAAGLSQMLLGPISSQLGNRRLLVVREGSLQLTPFEALPVPGAVRVAGPTYLVESNEIVALPSVSTLLAMRAAAKRYAARGRLVAIFADPVFSPDDDRVRAASSTTAQVVTVSDRPQQRVPRTSRLIYSSEEADAIIAAAPYGSTMVAKGFDASRETAMSPRLGDYQIVHFATHGSLDTQHPELSAIVLTMVDQNGARQNGVMPLNDIYDLDLAAELTVLSACETALGEDIKGEGLIGLTHGFLSAGSKSVVASLWKVDDRATAALMSHFYTAMLQEKLPPSAALRAAKLKMRQDKQWSAPYYWAGFVFQGDFESRINVDNNSRLVIGLVVLSLVLSSAGLIIFLRRRRRSSPAK